MLLVWGVVKWEVKCFWNNLGYGVEKLYVELSKGWR